MNDDGRRKRTIFSLLCFGLLLIVTVYVLQNEGYININVNITPPPYQPSIYQTNEQLSYSPISIHFGTHEQGWTGTKSLYIWNTGTGTLTYTINSDASWISVYITSGSSNGESDVITLSVANTEYMSGYYSGDVQILSNGGSGIVHVEITITSPSQQEPSPEITYIAVLDPGYVLTTTLASGSQGYIYYEYENICHNNQIEMYQSVAFFDLNSGVCYANFPFRFPLQTCGQLYQNEIDITRGNSSCMNGKCYTSVPCYISQYYPTGDQKAVVTITDYITGKSTNTTIYYSLT
ncbi:MAG: hypothetical protein NT038_10095 [Euryarchaeota archaeon]|nr:hypothetical protein [Euryarchaeota archaeon]